MVQRMCIRSAVLAVAAWLGAVTVGTAQPKEKPLRFATTGNIGVGSEEKAMAAAETLLSFVQEETGLESKIDRLKSWEELVAQMKRGVVGLGVFQGFEFAWAQAAEPKLMPLVVGVNVHEYPVMYLVTSQSGGANGLADLRGKAVSIPTSLQSLRRLFLDREVRGQGATTEQFFSKVVTPPNVEDALDDVVDGVVQAAVADRVAMEMYERRQPARAKKIKQLAQSQPFPPALIAYYDGTVDPATLKRFEQGVTAAPSKRKGQNVLQILRMTAFTPPPKDLNKVLAEIRKTYPRPKD